MTANKNSTGNGPLTATSRRTFLKATATTGTIAAVGGVASAQATSFRLAGRTAGWEGQEPQQIQGTTNPTLELEAGKDYEITWENADGAPHNIAILDSNGSTIQKTENMSQQGQTQSISFTASPEMAQYICQVHPSSMVGELNVSGGGGGATETTTSQDSEPAVPKGPNVGLQKVADGAISQPISFAVPPNDSRRFVADQNGQIYVITDNGLQQEPFLDISDKLYYLTGTKGNFPRPEDSSFDERGLLGLAFHPDFQNNGKFYLRYSAPPKQEGFIGPDGQQVPEVVDHTEVLAEYTASDDLSSGDPDSERILLEIPEPQFNHNAGDLAFGPDGYLYLVLGDGGGANDDFVGHVDDWYDQNTGGNGQDVERNLLGSVLRLDVDSQGDGKPYGVPDDNPLVGQNGLDEQYAWGLRNPWRMSFDSEGRLFVADVGQALYEEVNLVEKGGNYGWNVKEGTHCFSTENPGQTPDQCPSSTPDNVRGGEPLSDPIIEYPHTKNNQAVGTTVIGGHVYDGDALSDSLGGKYVFGDWSASFNSPQGNLWVATPPENEGDLWSMQELVVEGGQNGKTNRFILAFGQDASGEVYVLTTETGGVKGNGVVYKIVPPGEGDTIEAVQPPQTTTAQGEGTTTGQGTTTQSNETTTEGGASPDETPSTGQPGFGVLAALGGVASAVGYLLTRDEDEEE